MVWFLQDGDTYTKRIGGKDPQGIRKNQSSLLSMEELFRYYLENIIILRIGTGLRYLWLRFVRHRKISYRTLYEGSKSEKTTELSNFDNEMSNRAWGCGKVEWLRGKYRTTSEAINKSTITAIKLLILRSFQRKGLCNSGLKAKSTTFVNNIKTEYNGRKQYNSR